MCRLLRGWVEDCVGAHQVLFQLEFVFIYAKFLMYNCCTLLGKTSKVLNSTATLCCLAPGSVTITTTGRFHEGSRSLDVHREGEIVIGWADKVAGEAEKVSEYSNGSEEVAGSLDKEI